MRRLSTEILESTIGNIKYRNNVVTGTVAADNGNNTYNCYLSGSDTAYPNIPTTFREPDFEVGEAVEILIEYGNKEMPIIIGHAKKVAQEFVEDKINVLVSTLDPYSLTETSGFLEGRVEEIEGYENVIERGFHYGTSTVYEEEDVKSTGSFAAGCYSEEVTGLEAGETYHYQAYVKDAYNDEHTGEDKTFTTSETPPPPDHYLYSGCYETHIISKHNGISGTIIDSWDAPGSGYVAGLTNDGTNLISGEIVDGRIYIHDGFSSGVTSSFAAPAGNYNSGLAFDGTNLISSNWNAGIIYIHNGISSSISSSFDSPSTGSRFPRGLTVIGGNLISMDANSDRIYVHDGISSGVTSSFPSPAPQPNGLTNDGTNLISGDNGTYGVEDDHFYLHNGVSSGVTTTFNAPSGYKRLQGLTYI